MSRDFVPGSDANLDLWMQNFVERLSAQGALFGFSVAEISALEDARIEFNGAFIQSRTASNSAKAATAAKRDRRKAALLLVRPYARRLHAHPSMTDETRGTFGLSLRDAPISGTRDNPTPDAVPLLALNFGVRGQITVHFGPNPNNENRNPLADGAIGAVIQAIALNPAAPVSNLEGLTDWVWLDNATASPYVHRLEPTSSRLMAYRVAYVYRRGRRGPWSAAAQAAATF